MRLLNIDIILNIIINDTESCQVNHPSIKLHEWKVNKTVTPNSKLIFCPDDLCSVSLLQAV